MAVRETIQLGDPRLKARNKIITDVNDKKVVSLIEDLKDTMYKQDLIGIAAPQIGENYKVFITEPRATYARKNKQKNQSDILRVYINPEIVDKSDNEIIIYEGCGSVTKSGELFGPVSRPGWIKVRAIDEKGRIFEFRADGILGRVIQHEMDHLNGVEFTEKVSDYSMLMSFEHYVKQIKLQDWHQENSKITIKDYKLI